MKPTFTQSTIAKFTIASTITPPAPHGLGRIVAGATQLGKLAYTNPALRAWAKMILWAVAGLTLSHLCISHNTGFLAGLFPIMVAGAGVIKTLRTYDDEIDDDFDLTQPNRPGPFFLREQMQ